MGHKGRPRKAGKREPHGDLKRPTVRELELLAEKQAQKEMGVVLAQPHRNGSRDHRMGSALGRAVFRLTDENDLRDKLYYAGEDYLRLVLRWRRAVGATDGFENREAGPSSIHEISPEEIRGWQNRIARIDFFLAQLDHDAFLMTRKLILEDVDLPSTCDDLLRLGLGQLAIEFEYLKRVAHPFLNFSAEPA